MDSLEDGLQPIQAPSTLLSSSHVTGTLAEAYANRVAFVPNTNDVVFTVIGSYPDHHALYVQRADPLTGTLAPTATLYYVPDDAIEYLTHVESLPDRDIIVVAGVPRESPGHGYKKVYALAAGAVTHTHLTEGSLEVAQFVIKPPGDSVFLLDSAGELLAVDVATTETAVITSNLTSLVGTPYAELAVSQDGSKLAVVRESGTIEEPLCRLQVYDTDTGSWRTITDITDEYVSRPVFSADGSTIYYATSVATSSTNEPQFDVGLYSVDAGGPATPVYLADLSQPDQPVRVTELFLHPDGHHIIYLSSWQLFQIDTQSLQVLPLTSPTEKVVSRPALTSTPEGQWMAYVVMEALPPDTQYVNRDGSAMETGFFVRLRRLQ